jgi:hypothetical protein
MLTMPAASRSALSAQRKLDARGCSRARRQLPERRAECSMTTRRRGSCAKKFAGPSVARSDAADPEVEPQWLALIVHAGAFEWPRAVSGCLTPAAILIQPSRSGRVLALALGAEATKRSPRGPETDVEGGDCSPQTMNRSYACRECVSSSPRACIANNTLSRTTLVRPCRLTHGTLLQSRSG